MTYHVQILLLVRQPLFDRAALLLTQTSWVLPPLSVGKMTLRLYSALNYSHGLSKGPSFGTGRERDPSLTQQEALARIVEELRELRERSADHEDQLTGLKSYGDMARLNPAGLTGIARPGSGLSESSDLSRALEGAWDVDDDDVHAARCDQAALDKFSGVARKHPTFPFAHYALAICALSNENPTWRQHAERALAILEHTTQIAGRAGAHDQAFEFLLARLAGEQ